MRRAALLAAALAAPWARAEAQQPTVSPRLERLLVRDTAAAVWFFGARDRTLDEVAAAVRDIGGRPRHRSRWLHAVSALATPAAVAAARRRPEFRRLQPVAAFGGRPEEPAPAVPPPLRAAPAAAADSDSYGGGAMPMRRLDLFPLAARGLRGAGVTIAVLDTGFETELAAFNWARVAAQWDFVFGDSIVRNEPNDTSEASRHGTQTWSLLAANLPGQLIGIAPDADYLLAKTEDIRSERRVEEDHWVAAIEWADSIGVDVLSSSVGYLEFDDPETGYSAQDLNGDIAVTTIAADEAAARNIVVVTAAGNRGVRNNQVQFRSLITPADGDSVVAVGAEDSLGTLVAFSSRGPTADGRLKPDLVAPGRDVSIVDPGSPTGFARGSGTSYATPLVAGAAALLRQLQPALTAVEVRDALRGAGSNRDRPDSTTGWGRPDGAAAAYFPRGVSLTAPTDPVLGSVTPTFAWAVANAAPEAAPLTYRVRVGADSLTPATSLLDTTLADPAVTLLRPVPPGVRVVVAITAIAGDSVSLNSQRSEHVAPPWATLVTLDEPEGSTVREPRPRLAWTSPGVAAPPGPFTYDVAVLRADGGALELEATGLLVREWIPPRDLERNTPYRWRVVARLGADSAATTSRGTFVIVDDSAPPATLLFQNFPNPFPNPATGRQTTCIWFDLAAPGLVRLDVLDLRGHVVRTLVPGNGVGGILPAGRYGRAPVGAPGRCDPLFEWDGTAEDGTAVLRGIYLVRLVTPAGTFFKRMVFLGAGN